MRNINIWNGTPLQGYKCLSLCLCSLHKTSNWPYVQSRGSAPHTHIRWMCAAMEIAVFHALS